MPSPSFNRVTQHSLFQYRHAQKPPRMIDTVQSRSARMEPYSLQAQRQLKAYSKTEEEKKGT
ncbi:MAG: hypothetical protein LKG23_11360 [Nitrospira sp.]|jgi:hypothetical protein|nr:hypothetical protein [Nitrospira sp.]